MKQTLFLLITSGLNVFLKRVNCKNEGSQLQYALFQMKVAGRKKTVADAVIMLASASDINFCLAPYICSAALCSSKAVLCWCEIIWLWIPASWKDMGKGVSKRKNDKTRRYNWQWP